MSRLVGSTQDWRLEEDRLTVTLGNGTSQTRELRTKFSYPSPTRLQYPFHALPFLMKTWPLFPTGSSSHRGDRRFLLRFTSLQKSTKTKIFKTT